MMAIERLYPAILQIEPTTRCNLNCTYCTKKEPRRDLSIETLQRLIDKHSSINVIKLQGLGEPFMHPNFKSICKCCKDNDKFVTVTTNGTIFDEGCLDYIDRVVFSIDTLDIDKFNIIRPTADLDAILMNLHNTIPYCMVGINQVISKWIDRNDILDIEEFCRIWKLTLTQNRVMNWYGPESTDYDVLEERKLHGPEVRKYPTCEWGDRHFYYDADGIPHMCCIRLNDKYRNVWKSHDLCERCPD